MGDNMFHVLIVVTLVISFLLLYKIKKKNNIMLTDMKVVTTYPKHLMIIYIINYWFGIVVILISYIMHIIKPSLYKWIPYSIGIVLIVISFVCVFNLVHNNEWCNDEYLYYRRFGKIKKIKINSIKYINELNLSVVFYDENFIKLLSISNDTVNINELISFIKKDESVIIIPSLNDYSNFDKNEDMIDTKKDLYKQIADGYRNNFPKELKQNKIIIYIILLAITLFFLTVIILKKQYYLVFMFPVILFLFIIFSSTLESSKSILKKSDAYLALRFWYKDKRIIGSSKIRFKNIKIVSIVYIVVGLLFGLMLLLSFSKPAEKNDLLIVEGEVEYVRVKSGKYAYVAIAIKDNDIEFQLSSIYIDELDELFYDDIKKGDNIKLTYINENPRDINIDETDRKKVLDLTCIESNGYTYLSYEQYKKAFNDNIRIGIIMGMCGVAAALISSIVLIISYNNYKRYEKEEFIKLI